MNLTRRATLKALAGATLLFAATACQSAVDARTSAGDPSAAPEQGGVAEVGVNLDLVPANVFTNSNAAITTLVGLVYDNLVHYDRDSLDPKPALATEWSATDGGRTVTLKLRQGVKFHTGRPFTSADVKFSLATYTDPKWNGQLISTAKVVTAVETPAPDQVVLRLDHPVSNLFDLLATVPVIDSETAGDIATGKRFVGTGAFAFESWRPNTDLTFTRNADYWDGAPHLDGVHVRVVPDGQSLLAAVKSGQVHLARGIGYRDAEAAASTPGLRSIPLDGAELQAYVGLNVTAPGLDDPKVRQAVAYALDRDRIIKEVFRDKGYPASLPWPRTSPAYDEELDGRYRRDVGKAKALLAEHGAPVPEIPLAYVGNDPVFTAIAQVVQNNLAEAGITVKLEPVDSTQFVKQLIGAQFPGLWTTNHSWAQLSPATLTVSAYPFNARRNASHFSSPEYTGAAEAAWKLPAATGPEAVAAYRKVSEQLLDGGFLAEIGVVLEQFVARDALQGVDWSRRRELDLGKAHLR
ncbi:ABC transporter substrate-binding protein [Actinosynnema sp. NPDC047251]|uniref:ABC-type transporter, substrate-binding lipoprotein, family 5 n=1 Tax=Saccharothrix espanaensis (strain ATCC 51144 / DSM 44229 / JCM 9112 / NBRC 15066 / NRRL 15764) TaxID=1179773 RepID=K0K6I7_SACES|nr:ABC transporter substrate-binding protein [Saccharothrix espanaensis]CCH33107.1 ABC-type transporter, substrate-binding lipoprotein, family 5 [Saccharothrix espanaensis DSM 44229]